VDGLKVALGVGQLAVGASWLVLLAVDRRRSPARREFPTSRRRRGALVVGGGFLLVGALMVWRGLG
jgi:multisubunit Na+/H+ antiporter MnhB subunit